MGCTDQEQGSDYSRGLDAYTAKDYATAEPLLRKSAERGHSGGMTLLGSMYLFGYGVPVDNKEAMMWLSEAAAQDNVDAQSILGLMYLGGWGVPKQLDKAEPWLRLAAEAGDDGAIRGLQMLEQEVKEAQK